MKRTAMTTVLALSAVSLAAFFIAGAAAGAAPGCYEVPTMTWSDACLSAAGEALLHAPDTAAATMYALAAARRAMASYDATVAQANRLIRGPPVPGGVERAAYMHCVASYTEAKSRMAVVAGDMAAGCVVYETRLEYSKALAALQSCNWKLAAEFPNSPLVAMNKDDYDLSVLAVDLGNLIGGSLP
ncbi:unnamed protein product [Urochloa decumbens]|uniref:Pectinesterase inhibitor domain-containing protein n=1 Tax=Urochloa decumbens TaxID=240449 RepID=A0ABC9BY19_9POAL